MAGNPSHGRHGRNPFRFNKNRFVCVMLCFTWSCTCLAQNKLNNYYQQWSDGIELNIAPQARKFYCAAQRQKNLQGTHRFGFENTCCKCSDSSKITDPGPDPLTRGPLTRGRLTFPRVRGGREDWNAEHKLSYLPPKLWSPTSIPDLCSRREWEYRSPRDFTSFQ